MPSNSAEVERREMKRCVIAAFGLGHRLGDLLRLLPRHRDDAIADRGQLACNAEPETAARAGDQNVAHGGVHRVRGH